MKVKPIKDIDTAIRIYYCYPEIGSKEIKELFGTLADTTISRYKKVVQTEQCNRNILTSQIKTVNTAIAYEVWGIDVKDLERRRKRLKELGF